MFSEEIAAGPGQGAAAGEENSQFSDVPASGKVSRGNNPMSTPVKWLENASNDGVCKSDKTRVDAQLLLFAYTTKDPTRSGDAVRKWRGLRRSGRQPARFTAAVRAPLDAQLDDSVGPQAFRLLMVRPYSETICGELECFRCRRPRVLEDRTVVVMSDSAVLELRNTDALIGPGGDCWIPSSSTALMAEAFARDFNLASLTVQTIPRGGRA